MFMADRVITIDIKIKFKTSIAIVIKNNINKLPCSTIETIHQYYTFWALWKTDKVEKK